MHASLAMEALLAVAMVVVIVASVAECHLREFRRATVLHYRSLRGDEHQLGAWQLEVEVSLSFIS